MSQQKKMETGKMKHLYSKDKQLKCQPYNPKPIDTWTACNCLYKTALKNCNFFNQVNITLTISCDHSLESPSNWDTQ